MSHSKSYEKSFLLSAYKCLLPLLKKEKRKLLIQIMNEVIPKKEKNKFNFLNHNEFDAEKKIENKNPFEYDKSGSTLKCNETDYKIFAPNMNDTVGTDIAFVNTLNYMLEYAPLVKKVIFLGIWIINVQKLNFVLNLKMKILVFNVDLIIV